MTSTRAVRARRFGAALLAVGLCLAASGTPAGAGGNHKPPRRSFTVVQTGLSSPKGLTSLAGVIPIVAQGAFGPPGPVVLIPRPGRTIPISEPIGLVDTVVAADGSLWGIGGDQKLYRKTIFTPFKVVADIPAYQVTDPDPDDNEGTPEESNPYGLAALPGGDVLVADAANNDVLRVNERGRIRTVARFAREMISTDHIPGFAGPAALPTESVPTAIAVTRKAIYVGELKGFPFRPGSSRIYKIDIDAIGASCRPTKATRSCRTAERGLTSIQDIAIDRKAGSLYVYEFAKDGVGAFEEGLETGVFPPAVLLEIRHGRRKELAAGKLSQPGGVIAAFGVVHVTDGVFGDGRLVRLSR